MYQAKLVRTPLDPVVAAELHCGDIVMLTGELYTMRDAAHQRYVAALEAGQELPVDLRGQVVYYAGPTPARPGHIIGSCGPTTSGRMDAFTPTLLTQAGLAAMIGKGPRSPQVIEAMVQTGAVYFAAIGGAAALISQTIDACEVVAYDDLGPEAIRKLSVRDYPCIVAIDAQGASIYEQGPKDWRQDAD